MAYAAHSKTRHLPIPPSLLALDPCPFVDSSKVAEPGHMDRTKGKPEATMTVAGVERLPGPSVDKFALITS